MTLGLMKPPADKAAPRVADPLALLVVLTNVIPILGVFFLGWDAFAIVFVYWLETIVIGYFNILKMRRARPSPEGTRTAFFVAHYGLFCLGHLIFLIAMFLQPQSAEEFFSALASIGFAVTFVLMIFEHAYEYRQWLQQPMEARPTANEQMFRPYGRIVITHLSIFVAAFLSTRLPEQTALLVGIVAMKTLFDLAVGVVRLPDTGVGGRIKGTVASLVLVTVLVFGLCMIVVGVIAGPLFLINQFFFDGDLNWPPRVVAWGLGIAGCLAGAAGLLAAIYAAVTGDAKLTVTKPGETRS